MGNENKYFRSAMRGFNKEDVNAYVIELNREFSDKESELLDQINNLRRALEESEKEKNKIVEDMEELRNAVAENGVLAESLTKITEERDKLLVLIEEQNNNVELLQNKIDHLTEELKTQLDTNALSEKTITELKGKLNSAETQLSTLINENDTITSTDSDAEIISKYEHISSQIGDILISANKNADEIVKNAYTEAKKTRAESIKAAEHERLRIEAAVAAIIFAINNDLENGVDGCIREFKNYSEDILYSSKTMIDELNKKHQLLSKHTEYFTDSLEEALRKKLIEFKKNTSSGAAKKTNV